MRVAGRPILNVAASMPITDTCLSSLVKQAKNPPSFHALLAVLAMATWLGGCALPSPLTEQRATSNESFVTQPVAPSPQASQRTVMVLAVADGGYRTTHPQWQETITKDIAEVSQLYQREFGIALELVDTRVWDEFAALDMWEKLTALKRAYPITGDYDVVMGFTDSSGLLVAGISEILGNHLVVTTTSWQSTTEILAHELGHIFGAHDTFATSVTQFLWGSFSPHVLPAAFRLAIREHRWRLFRLPAAPPPS